MQPHRSVDLAMLRQARRVIQVTLASLALAAPNLVRAADPPAPRSPPPAQQPQAATDKTAAEASFVKADADKDGQLSKAEAASLPAIAAHFDELDRDKDGHLIMTEYMAAFGATRPGG